MSHSHQADVTGSKWNSIWSSQWPWQADKEVTCPHLIDDLIEFSVKKTCWNNVGFFFVRSKIKTCFWFELIFYPADIKVLKDERRVTGLIYTAFIWGNAFFPCLDRKIIWGPYLFFFFFWKNLGKEHFTFEFIFKLGARNVQRMVNWSLDYPLTFWWH